MIIWSGLGFLGLLIPIALYAAGIALGNAVGGPGYGMTHGWCGSLGLLLGAIALVGLDLYLSNGPGRLLMDPATGKEVVLRKKHTIFFMPMRFFAGLILIWAVYMFFHPEGLAK